MRYLLVRYVVFRYCCSWHVRSPLSILQRQTEEFINSKIYLYVDLQIRKNLHKSVMHYVAPD